MQVDPNALSVCGMCDTFADAVGLRVLSCWLDCVLVIGGTVIVGSLLKWIDGLFR